MRILTITALLILPLAACQNVPVSQTSGGFASKYNVARGALEQGQYDRAVRNYQNLLGMAGPLESRIRLEYAHSLLRKGQFDLAAQQAGVISQTEKGDNRLAALAVQGTAQHELARAAMAKGQRDAAVRSNLLAADQALKEVLRKGKKFDPLGSLANRRAVIQQELRQL